MKINEATFKMLSRIGSRATFGMAAIELGSLVDDLIILTGDTSTSAGLQRFKSSFPDKFLDVGISEQNLIGVAAGLASEGFDVFTTTFAPFQTMRCCEQIRVNLGYMKHKVCMVGLASGLVLGTLGFTHCCIEDLSIMRSIPNITVLSPADCLETAKATIASIEHKNPIYIRLTGGSNQPMVYKKDYNFEIGKGIVLKDGNDIAIFATGTMVYESIEASNILQTKGISAKIINMHTIKPFDAELVEKISKKVKLMITVEEHSIIGGLGTCVAEAKSKVKNSAPHIAIGLPQQFGKSEIYRDMLKSHNLTAPQIAQKILDELNNV